MLKLAVNEGFKMNYFRLELINILSMLKLLYISIPFLSTYDDTGLPTLSVSEIKYSSLELSSVSSAVTNLTYIS